MRKDDFARLGSFEINSVFNEAAMPGLIQDWGKFQPYYDCNISALNRLLEFVRTKSIASFVHASTSSVYGKNAVGKENQELRPTSPYGVSKLAAEKLLLAYLEWHSTPVRILRYFSVYGPNQRPDMAYAKIIENLKQGNEFVIHGDGEQRRSNTFIDDIVEATLLSENQAKPGDVMNICGDETVSLNQAISIIENSTEKSLKKRYVEARIGDQRETSGSNNFAKERLGWIAKVGIEEGLEIQVKAALKN
jgi:nucleoside-diphosphate-sugar epimerase